MWPAHAQRDLSFTVKPMDNDAPCAMGVQCPPVATTGRAGEPAAAHRPLSARTAVRLPKFSGVTQLDQVDQRDLQALTRALERQFGERVFSNQSRQLLASHRRKEEESLGVYAADIQLLTRSCYPEFSAATREALALHAFLRGLQPESLPPGTKNVGVKSRQRKGRVRTATLPATETAEASCAQWRHDRADHEPQQCRQLGLVEDCRWTGQRATHPRPSLRRGHRKAVKDVGGRRRMRCPNGAPQASYSGTWWGSRWRWSPTTPPGPLKNVCPCWRPNQGGRLRRNGATTGRGQGGAGGPLITRDCAMGFGVVGTSDPQGGGCVPTPAGFAPGILGIRDAGWGKGVLLPFVNLFMLLG
ncbi:unnamed protein product [Boreogadus saida]